MPKLVSDYISAVGEIFPGISPVEKELAVWQAISDICDENDLAFMIADPPGKIILEASYNTGTVQATNGSPSIVLTGGSWTTTWTNRKIRIKGQNEPYLISSFGSTTTATLSENWQGASGSALTYTIYRDVYAVPSDCALSKELLIWDTKNQRRIDLLDLPYFLERKRSFLGIVGTPIEAARVGLTSGAVPQLMFGYEAPSAANVLLLDYYKSPTKPTPVQSLSPAWPSRFERVIWERAIWKHADKKGHSRRFEFEGRYRDSMYQMLKKFNGGNEMSRRIAKARENFGEYLVHVRYVG